MSEAKWKASVASAGEPVRTATARNCRERQKSTAIEVTSTSTGQREWWRFTVWYTMRATASHTIHAQEKAIRPASANADRFSILPWP